MKLFIYTFKIFSLVVLILLGEKSLAQKTLSGTVSVAISNTSLEGVSVYITDLRLTKVTGVDGKYTFENLPAITVHVQFSSIGFKSVVKTINLETVSTLDLALESSTNELNEVLVSSDESKLSENVPFPTTTISQAELRKYGSQTTMGNLSYQPGIDKITLGYGIGKPVIRGLSFNRILLYGQGTRIENQQWDDHHDLGISDVGLESVEIIKGPAALIYGADALGGALIFVDEKPAPAGTMKGDATLGFASNTLGINTDVGLKGAKNNGLFYGARFGITSQTSYVQGENEEEEKAGEKEEEEEFAPNSKFMNMVGKFNVGVSKSWGVSKFSYSYLSQLTGIVEDESGDTSGVEEDEEEQREREFEAPYQDVTSQIFSLENTFFTGKSKLNLNLAYQLNDRKEFEPIDKTLNFLAIGLKLNATTYDLKWTSDADKELGVTIGSQGTFLNNENHGRESLVPNADITDVAGYGLIRYDHNKLNLLGGIRYDMQKIDAKTYLRNGELPEDTFIVLPNDTTTFPVFETTREFKPVSFSIGAAYHATEQLTLKVNLATGFRAPNYAELFTYGKHEGTYRFERGKSDLEMEENLQADLGIGWGNKSFSIDVNGYMNMVKSYIYIINTGDSMQRIREEGNDTLPIYDYRQGDATLKGGEFGIDIHPENIKWLDFKISYAMIRGTLDDGGNLPYIPSNKIVGEIKLTRSKLWKFRDAYCLLVVSNYQEQTNLAEYEIASEGYTLLDLHFGGQFKLGKQMAGLDLFCTNLLNTAYFNQLSLVKNIGVHDIGRNIGFQLRVPF